MNAPWVDPSKVHDLIAGGFGAFLSLLFQRRDTSKIAVFTTLSSAEIIDYYFAKPLWAFLHTKFVWFDGNWEGPLALTLGLLAIYIVGGITKMASDFGAAPWKTVADFVSSIVSRVLPGKKG